MLNRTFHSRHRDLVGSEYPATRKKIELGTFSLLS